MSIEYTVVNDEGRVMSAGMSDNPLRMGFFIDKPTVARPDMHVIINKGMQQDDVWWNGTAFLKRPDFDATNKFTNELDWIADGVDEITYGPALPNPTKVTVTCSSFLFIPVDPIMVTDGQLEMTATLPGVYKIKLESFPYLDKTIEVVAL